MSENPLSKLCKEDLSLFYGLDEDKSRERDTTLAAHIRENYSKDLVQMCKYELGIIKEAPVVTQIEDTAIAENPELANSVKDYEETQELIEQWKKVSVELSQLKEKEMKLREKISNIYFPNPKDGVNKTVDEVLGYEVKAEFSRSYNVSKTKLPDVNSELNKYREENPDVEVPEIFNVAKYSLIMRTYKQLDEDIKRIVDKAVTSSVGKPKLTIL